MATLYEYFLQDFPKYLSAHNTWKIAQGGVETELIVRVHLDFDSNTKFLSFYTPLVTNAPTIADHL